MLTFPLHFLSIACLVSNSFLRARASLPCTRLLGDIFLSPSYLCIILVFPMVYKLYLLYTEFTRVVLYRFPSNSNKNAVRLRLVSRSNPPCSYKYRHNSGKSAAPFSSSLALSISVAFISERYRLNRVSARHFHADPASLSPSPGVFRHPT